MQETSDQPPTHLLSWHPSSTTADIAEDHKNMPFFFVYLYQNIQHVQL